MLDLTQAQSRILAAIHPLGVESVSLRIAADRIAGEAVDSPSDLPFFDNSAMDGYAVRAEDLASVTIDHPAALNLLGEVAAGGFLAEQLTVGSCVRVFTGSPLPPGANAVVMQEETRRDTIDPKIIWFEGQPKPWEHTRFQGEDVKRGALLLEKGARLTIGRIGLLAALGVSQIRVGKRPVVGLLATGNELREGGEKVAPGQIYESNRVVLSALSARAGADPRMYPLVRDSLADTRRALQAALGECDVVLTSGGVSVGEFDFVKSAFQELGGTLDFWKVSMKPGKPFAFGQANGKPLFGLPGNPVSAFVTFLLLVRPAFLRLQGATDVQPSVLLGVLAESLANQGDRPHFMRVMVDSEGRVHSAGTQASHILSSLAEADGLVEVPKGTCLEKGTLVKVLKWA